MLPVIGQALLTAHTSCHGMRDGLEEEKAARQRNLDQHYHAGSNDVQKSDDVDNSNAIENDISWTSQACFP